MNKVTTINLNGRAYQLEEGGEAVLRKYLETAAAKLAGNPDKDEIMADFEQAIADKFDQKLNGHKNVVSEKEIEEIIAAMGPVEGESEPGESESQTSNTNTSHANNGSSGNPGAPKRLYRIPAGEWIMGVCNGLAAYFNVDVTLMRIIWILLAIFTHGFWIIAYIILAVVMPPVRSEEQFAAAHGWTTRPPFNANDFIEETKKRYAVWRAELEKMHDDHKAKMAEEHGWAKDTAAATSAASAAGADASATAQQTKENMKAWAKKMRAEMKQKKQQMKHEWRRGQHDWREEWQQNHRANRNAYMNNAMGSDEYYARRYGVGYGISRAIFGFFAVLVSIVLLAAGVAWVLTLYTLIKYGTVFGYAIGAGHPLWVSIVFLCAAFYIVTVPFRLLLQHAWGNARYTSGWSEFGRTLVFLAVCAALVFTARELFPQVAAWWNNMLVWLSTR